MNAQRLLALYDRVADAPDAIDRLRRFVLDLAVRGTLVEQNPADEPASELLKRIAAEKARLVKAGKLRRRKLPSRLDDPPFSLPENWHWTRIREVVSDRGQKLPDRSFTYIDVSAIDKKAGLVADPRVLEPGNAPSRARKIARSGDVVYSCVRPYLLNVAIIEDDFEPPPIASTAFEVLNGHGLVLSRYTWIVLRSPFMIACVERSQRGQAYPAINSTDFAALPFPLPPLAEQRRIVTKVDELMALCDRLEETCAAREDARDRLTKASLARLTAPDTDAAAFPGHARFAIHALPALTARNDQVKHLRQTILSLAVRGKLVKQDPADEPASALLELVRSQRPQAARGKRRLVHALNTGAVDAELFALPNGWEWTPLAGVSGVTMGQSPPGETYNRSGDGVPLINGPVEFTTGPFGRTIINQFTTSPKKFCEEGDLLLCVRGSTTGRTNVAGFRACIGRGVAAISSSFDDEFIRIFLWKAREDILAMGRGMAFPSVSKKQLESLPVPLPPLAEQHRIVAKVGELMVLCDRLEDGLGSVAGTRSHLLESLLQGTLTRAAYEAATAGAAWA